MTEVFRFDAHDDLFASRTTAEDWASIVKFREQPHFLSAVEHYNAISAPFYANRFLLNKVVPEAWRFQMIVFCLHLHDTRNPDDPRTGLTLGNFQKLCVQQDLASPGRAFAFLNIMRVGGYLARVRSHRDARVVHLAPTANFMTTVEAWNDGIFALIDMVVPDAALIQKRALYPTLGREMRRHSAERLLAGWKPLAPFPEVLHFAASDGGWMLLARCVAQSLRGGGAAPISINLETLGKQFGGSRSHLRRLLLSAYGQGLLDAPPSNGTHVLLSSRLTCAFIAWLASYLGKYHHSARDALVELERAK